MFIDMLNHHEFERFDLTCGSNEIAHITNSTYIVKLTVTHGIFILFITCLIVSIGQGEPAITPVYRDVKSKFSNS
jgi:hypothetical protein